MSDRLYYLMSSLPALPGLGHAPPITMGELLSIVRQDRSEAVRTLVDAFHVVALAREAAENLMLGYSWEESLGARPIEHTLPPVMVEVLSRASEGVGEDLWLTELRRERFNYLKKIGETIGSSFLVRWTEWDSALREQLVTVRSRSAGAVAAGGEAPNPATALDHSELVAEWGKAADPLAGERLLDEARIRFIETGLTSYSFDIDELVAYFLKLGLLLRHAALDREAGAEIIKEVAAL